MSTEMDPSNPSSFNHRIAKLSTGRVYHFVDQIPSDSNSDYKTNGRTRAWTRTQTNNGYPTVLCVHGFPDCWYGWRYQIKPWVERGMRVVVPDMLGYGQTDKPSDPREYSTKRLCADLNALLDLLGIQKAVLVGHDWGAFTVGRFALWYPQRTLALAILSVPYTPPSPTYIPVKTYHKVAPNLSYQAYFEDARSTGEIERNLATFLRIMYRTPGSRSASIDISQLGNGPEVLENIKGKIPNEDLVLNPKELAYYEQTFKQGGMNGPLNYYRTALFRYEEEFEAALPSTSPSLPASLPVLFIYGTLDTTTTPFLISKAHKFIPKLQDLALEERGHWVLVEPGARDVVGEGVAGWLKAEGMLEGLGGLGREDLGCGRRMRRELGGRL